MFSHSLLANALRILAVDAVEQAQSGHPGMPLGMADVATVLFRKFLKFNPADPFWPNRDRFVLSNGHGSMLLYGLLYLTGYSSMTLNDLKHFRRLGHITAGHPEWHLEHGIETTTGPLGQGLANAVGMALGERILAARFGQDLVDHYTYVMAGDGCLMEGISHEAISFAGHLQLSKLIVLFDDNRITIDGALDLSCSDDQLKRFTASNWHVQQIDGHNPTSIEEALEAARLSPLPSLIACRTIIGYGAPTKSNNASAHGSPLGSSEIQALRQTLEWPYAPFEIPASILEEWRTIGQKNEETYQEWQARLKASSQADAFQETLEGKLGTEWIAALADLKHRINTQKPAIATRQASQQVLDAVTPLCPTLIGGSADLTPSNNTRAAGMAAVSPPYYTGQYIFYGIREHAMGAIMNGLFLHGGTRPYGGTFLAFSDYLRPSLRLSALMGLPVIYVFTHDSIGLGEDGPTHQPVEHLASLRALPHLHVLRPADALETIECWEIALQTLDRPCALILTRQNVPAVRELSKNHNLCALGGYVIAEAQGSARHVTLLATGSEVQIALKARILLEAQHIPTAVVSLPCWSLFDQQPPSYQEEVLGDSKTLRIAIEAAVPFGWDRYKIDDFIGMHEFGASAPASVLYEYFEITAEKVVQKALLLLKGATHDT